MRVFLNPFLLIGLLTLCLRDSGYALVIVRDRGEWPSDWPSELESLRPQAKTYVIAHGLREVNYEIFFGDRSQFESVWPQIKSLATTGSVLTLLPIIHSTSQTLFNNEKPCVRIK